MNNDDDTTYHPIPCADYDRFERAIMHGQQLRVAWRAADGSCHLNVLYPLDLQTQNHQEFLIAITRQGERVKIRLDQIAALHAMD